MGGSVFQFKQFKISQDRCAMKVGTDGVLLGAWADVEGAQRILDLGTGTGLLALIAAQRAPGAKVEAIEIDPEAAMQASENAADSSYADRIRVYHMDARRMVADRPFDHILCNPPYYPDGARSKDELRALARDQSSMSWKGLFEVIQRNMTEAGKASIIIPADQEAQITELISASGLLVNRMTQVHYLQDRPAKRLLMELRHTEGEMILSKVIIGPGTGHYHPSYVSLVEDLLVRT